MHQIEGAASRSTNQPTTEECVAHERGQQVEAWHESVSVAARKRLEEQQQAEGREGCQESGAHTARDHTSHAAHSREDEPTAVGTSVRQR